MWQGNEQFEVGKFNGGHKKYVAELAFELKKDENLFFFSWYFRAFSNKCEFWNCKILIPKVSESVRKVSEMPENNLRC